MFSIFLSVLMLFLPLVSPLHINPAPSCWDHEAQSNLVFLCWEKKAATRNTCRTNAVCFQETWFLLCVSVAEQADPVTDWCSGLTVLCSLTSDWSTFVTGVLTHRMHSQQWWCMSFMMFMNIISGLSLWGTNWSKPLNESTDALAVGAKCSGLTSISQMLISGSFWTVSCKLLYLLYAFCCFLCSLHSKVKQCFQWETLSNLKRQMLMNYCNNLTTIFICLHQNLLVFMGPGLYVCVCVCVSFFWVFNYKNYSKDWVYRPPGVQVEHDSWTKRTKSLPHLTHHSSALPWVQLLLASSHTYVISLMLKDRSH